MTNSGDSLTPFEKKVLIAQRTSHELSPTVLRTLRQNAVAYLPFIPLVLGAVCLQISSPSEGWIIPALTCVAGMVVRDLRWIYTSVKAWPVCDRVIDWKKVDELLAADADAGKKQ